MKVLTRTLITLAVLVMLLVGYVVYSMWPWFFPPKHVISDGTFENLVRIGATKNDLLADSRLKIYSTGVPWVIAAQATPEQVALLMSSDEWGVDAGAATCQDVRSCPGADIHFSNETVSDVEVTCHVCP